MTSTESLRQTDPQVGEGHGPLAGVRVIELGMLIAGPFAGRLLGDMGAEIIKVEAPDKPDPMREWGQQDYDNRSLWWPIQSRNKKCITLNLRHPKGQDLLLRLVEQADVIVENFRPGTLEKWNLAYDRLSEANPAIILARISGFGQSGPYRDRVGFASVAEAMGGLRYVNGYPGEAPPRIGISLGDSLGALFATQGVLSALYRRDALDGRKGQVIDVSLVESCFALLESMVPEYDRLGKVREPSGTSLSGIAPSNLFKSRDGKWVVIAANHDNLFRRLCETMGMPELARDERFIDHRSRGKHQAAIEDIVSKWASQHTAKGIDDLLNSAGVACGQVYSIADIFDDPHFRERDMLLEHHGPDIGPCIGPGVIPKFSETPGHIQWSGPEQVGSHNSEIYGTEMGLSEEELTELHGEAII